MAVRDEHDLDSVSVGVRQGVRFPHGNAEGDSVRILLSRELQHLGARSGVTAKRRKRRDQSGKEVFYIALSIISGLQNLRLPGSSLNPSLLESP